MKINQSLITYIPELGPGSGTVTSVGFTATMPTGLSAAITGSPITSAGVIDLSLSFAAGYAIPTTIKQSNWDDAYTWVTNFPSQTGQVGKFLTTDGSVLSWGTPSSVNIYNTSGTLTGNRLVTGSGYFLQFDANIGIGKNPAYPLDVNGTAAATGVLTTSIFNANNPIYIYTNNDPSNATYGRLRIYYDSIQHRITSEGSGGASRDLSLMGGGPGGQLYFGTSGVNKWFITGSYNGLGNGHFLPTSDTIYNIGDPSARVWKFYGVKGFYATNLQIGGTTEYNSSLLTMESTNKGFLPPRMTAAQRAMISLPQIGLIVYETDVDEGLWQFTNNSGWQQIGGVSGTVTSVGLTSSTVGVTISNTPITSSGNINIEIAYSGTATDGLLGQDDWNTFNSKMNNPFSALGQMLYSNAIGIPLVVAPNTTTTKKFLSMTGNGTVGAAPVWSDISGSIIATGFQIDYDSAVIGTRNSVNKIFTVSSNFVTGSTRVFVNGLRYSNGASYDYVESAANEITFTNAPDSGDLIIVEYVKL